MSSNQQAEQDATTLLVYFSRAGENYFNGGRTHLDVGNTEVLARMIGSRISCDIYRIQSVDPYPDDYDAAVERNVREQQTDARPPIANPLESIDRYDTVLLGSPIWNVRPPMIVSTFLESYDFRGKTIYPFVTDAMSGLGRTLDVYVAACPGATIGEGLAVRGEHVQSADDTVQEWLHQINLVPDEVSHGR